MRKDKAFLEFASKLWPGRHRRFEDMCVHAMTGQLGGAQMCELDEHIANCERCRAYFKSIAKVSVQMMPLLADDHAPERKLTPPAGMRERFLARLAAQPMDGANGKSARPMSIADAAIQERPNFRLIVEENPRRPQSPKAILSPSLWRPVAIGVACVIVVAGAYYAGMRRTVQPPPQVTMVHPNAPTPISPTSTSPVPTKPTEPDRVSQLERQKSELETKLAAAKQELATEQGERESLNNELAATKEKLAALTQQTANRTTRETQQVAQQTNEQVSALQADVSRLSQRLAESEIKFGIQKQENHDLSSRLTLTEADLQRERDLKSAKSEMGELAASRNLHIVDVYDADRNGKRQRSFGRVFYIEGQSLVFYAYDLDDPGQFRANVVFHVWGGKTGLKNGVKEVTHSLGILHKDDSGQNRWAMNFDDPHVLSQINSVFVTAEAASKNYDQPHGKKVLFAYFGNPANHP